MFCLWHCRIKRPTGGRDKKQPQGHFRKSQSLLLTDGKSQTFMPNKLILYAIDHWGVSRELLKDLVEVDR